MRHTVGWAVGLFVVAQLAAGVLFDDRFRDIRFPSAGIVLRGLRHHEAQADIVCLGSSRFMHGLPESVLQEALDAELRPSRRAKVLNAAVPAGDPVSSDYMMGELLRAGARPTLAIVEITPEAVNHFNTWLSIHVQRQLGWADVPAYFHDLCFAHQFIRLVRARLLPLYVHRRELWREGSNQLRSLAAPGSKAAAADPTIPLDELREALGRTGVAPAEYTPHGASLVPGWLRHYQVGGTAAAALDRLLERCQANNIEVVLVSPPLTSAHRQAYSPAIEAAFQSHVHRLATKHGCRFVDYRERLPDDLFIDNHHLLPDGGRRFSELLAREVLAPLYRDTAPAGMASR